MMQQMLVQQLQQGPQGGSFGGGAAGPQMQGSINPMNAAANLVQKAMLVKALQNSQQGQAQQQFTANQPAMQAQMANDPTMQALQQSPQLDPNVLAQLQQQPPIAPPGGGPTQ